MALKSARAEGTGLAGNTLRENVRAHKFVLLEIILACIWLSEDLNALLKIKKIHKR